MAGFVYFAGSAELDEQVVKIGHTKADPTIRRDALQTGCPFALDIIAYAPGTLQDERKLHERFKSFRKAGEWFYLEGFLQAYVADLGTGRLRGFAPTLWTELYLQQEHGR